MTYNFSPEASDPQHLHQAKEGIVAAWHELPAEHQATLLLILLKDVINGEYKGWALDAIQRLYLSGKGADGVG